MSAEVLFAYYLVTMGPAEAIADLASGRPPAITHTGLKALCSGCAQRLWEDTATFSMIQINRDHGNFATLAVHRQAMDRGEITACEDCGTITREEFTRRQQALVVSPAPTTIRDTAEVFGEGEEGEGEQSH